MTHHPTLLGAVPLEESDADGERSGQPMLTARLVARGFKVLAVFAGGLFAYAWEAWRSRAAHPLIRRARWMHGMSRRLAWAMELHGPRALRPLPPGLVVSNHLSYLDILAFGSIGPCVFVSKREVACWPLVGLFARAAGTIFIDRHRRSDLVRVNALIERALDAGVTVVLFPEGTSSDGCGILPLKPSALEPVAATRHPVTAAAVAYGLWDGSVADEVCYWREMTFLPHFLNLLTKRHVVARIGFGPTAVRATSRKELAVRLREEIAGLRSGLTASLPG
jgi:1-acyl-sn-glycerol-3-phosphate acyltransferase